MEAPLFVRSGHALHQVGERDHRVLVELHHVLKRHGSSRIPVIQVAQQEAERVADTAIRFARAVQDLAGDVDVLTVVGRACPQAHDVRARLGHHIVGKDRVAQRLRHLATVAVHDETMREHFAERWLVVGADAREQAGLEPAAVLVRALQVHVGGTAQLRPRVQHAGVRDTRLPPHIQDVVLGLELCAATARACGAFGKILGRLADEPRVRAFDLPQSDDGVECSVGRDRLAALHAREHRDRDSPGALPRDAPVRAVGDHRGDPVDRPSGDPLDCGDGLQRTLAKRTHSLCGFVHRDEPLLGGAEDDRTLAAPAVRIAVVDLAGGHKRPTLTQPVDDDRVRLPHVQALERAAASIERAVVTHGHGHRQAELQAHQVVVLAMTGCGVHSAGAGGELHVVAGDDHSGHPIVDRLLVAQSGELGALDARRQHLPGVPVRLLRHLLHQLLGHHEHVVAHAHAHVVGIRRQRDRHVGRQRPGSRRPDHDIDLTLSVSPCRRLLGELELDVDAV